MAGQINVSNPTAFDGDGRLDVNLNSHVWTCAKRSGERLPRICVARRLVLRSATGSSGIGRLVAGGDRAEGDR